MSAMVSQIPGVSIVCSQSFVQAQITENIKAPRHWPLWGESTGARWFPLQRQITRKCFHLMTSWWCMWHMLMCRILSANLMSIQFNDSYTHPKKPLYDTVRVFVRFGTGQFYLIINYMHSKMCDNIIYPCEWKSNFTPHFIMDVISYLCGVKIDPC